MYSKRSIEKSCKMKDSVIYFVWMVNSSLALPLCNMHFIFVTNRMIFRFLFFTCIRQYDWKLNPLNVIKWIVVIIVNTNFVCIVCIGKFSIKNLVISIHFNILLHWKQQNRFCLYSKVIICIRKTLTYSFINKSDASFQK